jgi:ribosomal protein S18 acetylase RimI-like enzyme
MRRKAAVQRGSILIRDPEERDRPLILKVLAELMSAHGTPYRKRPQADNEALLRIIRGCRTFIAELDGVPAGMNAVFIRDLSKYDDAVLDKVAHIQAIGVEKAYRRRGVGARR